MPVGGSGAEIGTWELPLPRERTWTVGPAPAIVGILNRTPDSFSDGGRFMGLEVAVRQGLELLAAGADCLDVGGESTRPGSQPVSSDEQIERVCPVIRALRQETDAPISVDTMSPEVARAALEAGADVVNDVNGFREDGWAGVLRDRPVPLILMHMQGKPPTMQDNPHYPRGVTREVKEFFDARLEALSGQGVARGRILLDPGIGFGKRLQDNLELLRDLGEFRSFGCPLYVGASRKGFIGTICERELSARDVGTVATNAAAVFAGANVLRVHNVPYARDLVRMLTAIRRGRKPEM
jgi:dihydropteroate synthase